MNKTKFFILVTIVVILWGNPSAAQETPPPERLTLEEAVTLAMTHHPRIVRFHLESRAAEESVRTAR